MENYNLLRIISMVSHQFKNKMRQESEKLGMNSSYRPFLRNIVETPGLTQVDLVKLTGLKAPTVSLTLGKMELDGLVKRELDEKDQRIIHVFPTPKANKLHSKMHELIKSMEEKYLEVLTEEEKEEAVLILNKILSFSVNENNEDKK